MSKYDKCLKYFLVTVVVTVAIAVIFIGIKANIAPKINNIPSNNYKDTITVYADEDYAPYSFIDEQGNPQGYDIELVYMLASEMQVNVDLQLIPWTMNLEELDITDADMVLGLEYTPETEKKFNLSHPVQFNDYIAFGKEPLKYTSQLHVKKLGILDGSIAYDLFIEPNHLQENTVYYKSYEEGYDAILNNDIDYLIGRYSVGKRLLANEEVDEIKPTGEVLTSNTFCYGVSKNEPELFENLNQSIDKLNRSGNIQELTSKWLGHHVHITSFEEFIEIYTVHLLIFSGIISIVIFYLYIKRQEELFKLRHQKIIHEKLQKQLEVDLLTGGLSYYKFETKAQEIFKQHDSREYMIISIDVDDFKYVNESYGYENGNVVLKKISEYLTSYLQPGDLITRINADKFVILAKSLIKEQFSSVHSDQLQSVEDILGQRFTLTFSIGVYIPSDQFEAIDYMIDCADVARLESKTSGKSNVSYFTEEMRNERLLKHKIVSTMEKALINEEFYVVYQPKYDLKTNQCIGAEALVRWKTSSGEAYYPDQFIPLFESNGFIVRLDYYIFETVCKFISNSESKLPIISINLSGKTLLKPSLVKEYCDILKKYNIIPSQIEIEITESLLSTNVNEVKRCIELLKQAGFTIAMDDFGTGESSLNRLQNTSVDILKIDREFLNRSLDHKKGNLIIKNILRMSKDLKLITVAEGIETKEQLELLKSMDCDIGQGFYFSKPLEQNDFIKVLK